MSGVITGVTVADGTTKVIVESNGQTYQVDIGNIAYVYEMKEQDSTDGGTGGETDPPEQPVDTGASLTSSFMM